jgi:2-polyprenyl-3-methyl-5-hydroxy-6-metoxy-1,4-benzoquinol methylase
MNENLKHWYDGWFYDSFIAPNQDKAFRIVKDLIDMDSTLLDAGCGTGRFCFQMNDKCSKVDGIDASIKNIDIANKNYDSNFHHKIKFYHNDIKSFLEKSKNRYGYAILSYVIHEIDEAKRIDILKILSLHARKIIIIDYLSPHPKSLTGIMNRIVEFFAGRTHYKNFKTYLKNDGIKGLVHQSKLNIIKEIKNNPPSSHIAIVSK